LFNHLGSPFGVRRTVLRSRRFWSEPLPVKRFDLAIQRSGFTASINDFT
jgi:hypothetical protein